jgi:excisionase family DNA binding protein
MGRRVGIKEAAAITGLSEYTLRSGIKQNRFPHIRTGLGSGKFLLDIELMEEYLRQEAKDNTMPAAQSNVIHYGQLRRIAE